MTKQAKQKMEKLTGLINYYNHQYFIEHKSDIDDAVFDQLVRNLKILEEKYPEYADPNSPTQIVGERSSKNTLNEVKHKLPMQSLSKAMNEEELADFFIKLNDENSDIDEYTLEIKVDGLAISLYYEDGIFIQGATRGDGGIGNDVTQTVSVIADIPKKLNSKFNGEVRGEAYMKKSSLIKLNKTRELLGLNTYENERNIASGLIKRKEVTEENELMSFFAYGIYDDEEEFSTYEEGMLKLEEMGFKTALLSSTDDKSIKRPEYKITKVSKKKIDDLVSEWKEIRDKLDFLIDGLVAKVNKVSVQERLGMTRHSPRWATAYKFPAVEAITTLLSVEWTMGNKGNITPNARIEPVRILGTTISNITLHNLEELKRLGIMVGDQIVVSKRGDVIPKVERVLTELRTGDETPIQIPTHCPIDGAPTVANGAFLKCSKGSDCGYMEFAKIQNYVYSVEIDELGPVVLEKMLADGIVKDLADLYDVKPEQIENLERMGKRSANKLVKNIQATRDADLSKVLSGLTINGVGNSTGEDLAEKFKSLESFLYATEEELISIEGIGPKTAHNIYQWCQDPKNQNVIYKLIDREVGKYKELEVSSSKLAGKVFATSGKVSIPRKQLEAMIEDNGGHFESIKKGITHFIAGDGAKKPKIDKAESYGAEVITEEDFLNMLK